MSNRIIYRIIGVAKFRIKNFRINAEKFIDLFNLKKVNYKREKYFRSCQEISRI